MEVCIESIFRAHIAVGVRIGLGISPMNEVPELFLMATIVIYRRYQICDPMASHEAILVSDYHRFAIVDIRLCNLFAFQKVLREIPFL